jgi:integrase
LNENNSQLFDKCSLFLIDHLPEYLKGFVTFAYKTGWRVSEIADLTWQNVDREQGIVRIEAGRTKNDEARTVYMDEELKEAVKQKWEARIGKISEIPGFPREHNFGHSG